ncbi:hypothetical protein NA647_19240 [Pseudomonas stutzeri]|uniref:hypothetical protein n=1 Tax=Stutzerimonas stutzeri TaxID=316 RepID=UPI00210BF360|nr:hypothetical protein [Stutzerimonas stutzeri]MCQ4289546.1 hypothetical protein [Stutzerimonas stutzeri]
MKILQGFVQGVIEKGQDGKKYAVVAINDVSKNRNGFDQTELVEFMVAGQQFKDGLQNAYRQHTGAEVYAPYSDELDSFNGKSRIRYQLQGVPLRLQEARPVQSAPAGQPAAKAAGAN